MAPVNRSGRSDREGRWVCRKVGGLVGKPVVPTVHFRCTPCRCCVHLLSLSSQCSVSDCLSPVCLSVCHQLVLLLCAYPVKQGGYVMFCHLDIVMVAIVSH